MISESHISDVASTSARIDHDQNKMQRCVYSLLTAAKFVNEKLKKKCWSVFLCTFHIVLQRLKVLQQRSQNCNLSIKVCGLRRFHGLSSINAEIVFGIFI